MREKKSYGNAKRIALACRVLGIAKKESRSSVVDTPAALFHRDSDKECKKAKLTVIGFKMVEFITIVLHVQKCKQERKNIHWRLELICLNKSHREMKGIIQMTILAALAHL